MSVFTPRNVAGSVVLLFGSMVFGQAEPAPSKQLAKFDRLMGEWEGSGTYSMSPEQKGTWTATVSFKKALGGHFILDETRVKLDMPEVPAFDMVTYWGWNKETNQGAYHHAASEGDMLNGEYSWADADTLIFPKLTWSQGAQEVAREMFKITKTGWDLEMISMIGSAPPLTLVKGSFRRPQPAGEAASDEVETTVSAITKKTVVAVEPAGEMAKLKGFLGTWSFTGKYTPAPGAPAMDISGRESFSMVQDGRTMMIRSVGDPADAMGGFVYEGHAFMSWNPRLKSYTMMHMNNMGEHGSSEARLTDNGLVATSAMAARGQLTVARHTFEFKKDGTMEGYAHTMVGTNAPSKAFEGQYKRLQ